VEQSNSQRYLTCTCPSDNQVDREAWWARHADAAYSRLTPEEIDQERRAAALELARHFRSGWYAHASELAATVR